MQGPEARGRWGLPEGRTAGTIPKSNFVSDRARALHTTSNRPHPESGLATDKANGLVVPDRSYTVMLPRTFDHSPYYLFL